MKIEVPSPSRHISEGSFNCMFDLSPREYSGCVKVINENARSFLSNRFLRAPLDRIRTAIVITGSDGKSERHPQSKTELIIITSETPPAENHDSVLAEWYAEEHGLPIDRQFGTSPKTGLPELRTIGIPTLPLSYAFDDKKLAYPDRILNSQVIFGDEELVQAARKQVLVESTEDDEVGKKVRQKIKTQLTAALGGLKTGTYNHNMLFTTEPPIHFYDESKENYTVGFKTAGMRSIQRMADLVTFRSVREGQLPIDEALTFPTDTIGRIEALREKGLVPKDTGIIDAFEWFLQQYHIVQDRYKSKGFNRHGTSAPFELSEFLTHRDSILQFWESIKGKPHQPVVVFNR